MQGISSRKSHLPGAHTSQKIRWWMQAICSGSKHLSKSKHTNLYADIHVFGRPREVQWLVFQAHSNAQCRPEPHRQTSNLLGRWVPMKAQPLAQKKGGNARAHDWPPKFHRSLKSPSTQSHFWMQSDWFYPRHLAQLVFRPNKIPEWSGDAATEPRLYEVHKADGFGEPFQRGKVVDRGDVL